MQPEDLLKLLGSQKLPSEGFPSDIDDLLKVVRGQETQQQQETIEFQPDPGFVVKTLDDAERKVFINVMSSQHVPAPGNWTSGKVPDEVCQALESTQDHNLNDAESECLRFPVSCGELRYGLDRKETACSIIDVVFNSNIVGPSTTYSRLKRFVVVVAMQAVVNKHKLNLNDTYKLPKLTYKGDYCPPHLIRKDPAAIVHSITNVPSDPSFPLVTKRPSAGPRAPPPNGLRDHLTTVGTNSQKSNGGAFCEVATKGSSAPAIGRSLASPGSYPHVLQSTSVPPAEHVGHRERADHRPFAEHVGATARLPDPAGFGCAGGSGEGAVGLATAAGQLPVSAGWGQGGGDCCGKENSAGEGNAASSGAWQDAQLAEKAEPGKPWVEHCGTPVTSFRVWVRDPRTLERSSTRVGSPDPRHGGNVGVGLTSPHGVPIDPVVTVRGKEVGVVWDRAGVREVAKMPVFVDGQRGRARWWPDCRGVVVEVGVKHVGDVVTQARDQQPHVLGSLGLASGDMLDVE